MEGIYELGIKLAVTSRHGVTSKTAFFTVTSVKTSNPTSLEISGKWKCFLQRIRWREKNHYYFSSLIMMF
jgi:hypothetical protein